MVKSGLRKYRIIGEELSDRMSEYYLEQQLLFFLLDSVSLDDFNSACVCVCVSACVRVSEWVSVSVNSLIREAFPNWLCPFSADVDDVILISLIKTLSNATTAMRVNTSSMFSPDRELVHQYSAPYLSANSSAFFSISEQAHSD